MLEQRVRDLESSLWLAMGFDIPKVNSDTDTAKPLPSDAKTASVADNRPTW